MVLVGLHWCDECTDQHILLQQATWNPDTDPALRVCVPWGVDWSMISRLSCLLGANEHFLHVTSLLTCQASHHPGHMTLRHAYMPARKEHSHLVTFHEAHL